jgi:hypothetical protein
MAAACLALVFWVSGADVQFMCFCFISLTTDPLQYFAVLLIQTFHLAKIQAKNEALGAFFYFTQEACLTLNINLLWPQQLLDIFSWISTIFNLQVSFAGPECFGEWGFAGRWAANVMSPLILLAVHGIVYLIKRHRAEPALQGTISSQLKGSLLFWMKILFMMMLELSFQIWVCEAPTMGANASTVQAKRLVKDPSMTCNSLDGSPWPGLLTASIFLFCFFGLAFPLGSFWVVSSAPKTRRDTEELFRVSYGVLYAAFDSVHWWWYVVPVTLRRMALQVLSLALQRHPVVLAGLFITIHTLYGGALALNLPYVDPVEDVNQQGSGMMDALDILALFHAAIQVCLVVIGLVSRNESNAAAMTALAMVLYACGAAASAYVFSRIKKRARRKTLRQEADANIVKASVLDSIEI